MIGINSNAAKKVKRCMMWFVLGAIAMLIVLCIVGAFYGSEKAKVLFNSVPIGVYFCLLLGLFVAGLFIFPTLLAKPGLLFIHAGCLFVLAGGMCGSAAGHEFTSRLFGVEKIPAGSMLIYEGQSENRVLTKSFDSVIHQLPFSIKLKDFRIDYYEGQVVRDYFSDVAVIDGDREVLTKTIEVNGPLYYGGYHFYQHSYGDLGKEYTVLSVTSDSGLLAVYVGYGLLCGGIFGRFWFSDIAKMLKLKSGRKQNGD